MIAIEAKRGPLLTYLALPTGPAPWPGVLMLHDFFARCSAEPDVNRPNPRFPSYCQGSTPDRRCSSRRVKISDFTPTNEVVWL